MDLTAEKLAFIQGQGQKISPKTETRQSEEKLVEIETASESVESTKIAEPRVRRKTARRINSDIPVPSDVLDQVLVPVTIRLPHKIAQALKRAYLEQRLKHALPDTQQQIVEEALEVWLDKMEYLK